MKKINIISIIVIVGFFASIPIITYGAITLDDNNRREYGYCPISPETMSSRVQFEINGCPVVRVYIVNWNQLTTLEQTTLDTQMRSAGFRDIGEFDARVR